MLYFIASLIVIVLAKVELSTTIQVIATCIVAGLATAQYWSDYKRNRTLYVYEHHVLPSVAHLCEMHMEEIHMEEVNDDGKAD